MASIAYTSSQVDASNATTYTFTGMSFGAASADRQTVVCFATTGVNNGGTISSATINGVTATVLVQRLSTSTIVGVLSAANPTGTSGTVSVTLSTGKGRAAISVYKLTGSATGAFDTANAASGDPISGLIDVPLQGSAIAIAAAQVATAVTWTGLTEDADIVTESFVLSSASGDFATVQTNLSVSGDYVGSPVDQALVIVSWAADAISGTLSASGAAATSFTGEATASATFSAAGTSATNLDGEATFAGVLSASGDVTVAFDGTAVTPGVLSAAGLAVMGFEGTGAVPGVFHAAGVATSNFISVIRPYTSTNALQMPVDCVLAGQQDLYKGGRARGRALKHVFGE